MSKGFMIALEWLFASAMAICAIATESRWVVGAIFFTVMATVMQETREKFYGND